MTDQPTLDNGAYVKCSYCFRLVPADDPDLHYDTDEPGAELCCGCECAEDLEDDHAR